MYYNKEEIAQFRQGIVVMHKKSGHLGHVVGFDVNAQNEVLVLVQWADGKGYNTPIHPVYLEIL